MSGSSPAALGGQVHVEVQAGDDALQPVDLAEPKKTKSAAGAEDDDRDDQDENHDGGDRDEEEPQSADRGGDDDDDGYNPARAQDRLRAARRGERKAKTRASKLERQMVRLSLEVDGLTQIAGKALEAGAKDRQADANARYQDAWKRRTKAFEDGNSADWNKAEADIKAAERDFAAAGAEAATAQQRASTGTKTAVLQDWLNDPENDWYDPTGGDEDSNFARELSAKVKADGFPINSQAHFDELTRRLKKQRPHLYDAKRARQQDDDVEQTPRQQERSGDRERDRGPRSVVGGRRDNNDGAPVNWDTNTKVPKELVRNYQAAGFDVTDPKVKDRMIKQYNSVARSLNGGTINVG